MDNMIVRQYAKQVGFEIIGKLTRRPEYEYDTDYYGNRVHSGCKTYEDEAKNIYHTSKKGICIVTADDEVI